MNERDIFHAAMEITDLGERCAFLDRECAHESTLRQHVQDLLEMHPYLGDFLETSAVHLDTELSSPIRAGRFRLGEELAHGGMGIVYRARDASLDRDVAVKVLREEFVVDPYMRQRFLDEARITAQLQHPCIPAVIEVSFLSDERPYLAMKLVRGQTLEKLLQERPTLEAERGRFLSVFQQICQAVAYAHSKRILHRDLKPANVMVGAFGEVQVMDWGLAKVLEPSLEATPAPSGDTETNGATIVHGDREPASRTQVGSILGTLAFMPPEQAGGDPDKLDERSDVFGLGGILCFILTGKPPYAAHSADELRLMAVRGELAPAYARLDQCGADAKLIDLCRHCLSADRAYRPRDASAMAAAITDYLAGVEERARRAELDFARAVEQRKRRRIQVILVATLLGTTGLVGFGLWWKDRTESAAQNDRATRQSRTGAAVVEALHETRQRVDEAWTLIEFPDRLEVATNAAVAAFDRADNAAGVGAADEETRADLAATRLLLEELTRHTRLICLCDREGWELLVLYAKKDFQEGQAHLTKRHTDAFRDFGLDVMHAPTEEIARAVAVSRTRDSLLGILLQWHFYDSANEPLSQVVRSTRRLCGGTYSRWQQLLDDKDVRGLVAFASSSEAMRLPAALVIALSRDLRRFNERASCYALLRAAVEQYPQQTWLQLHFSSACASMGPPAAAEALSHCLAATVQRPDNPCLHLKLADCYAHMELYDQAIASYSKAIMLAPETTWGYENLLELADYLAKIQNWPKAIAAVEEAIRHRPKSVIANIKLTETLAAVGRHAEALQAAMDALRRHADVIEDPHRWFRFSIVCLALQWANATGANALPGPERLTYRRQALELAAPAIAELRKLAATDREFAHKGLAHWLTYDELASVRDPMSLANLPADEREGWNKLWAEVRALHQSTAPVAGN